MIKIFDPNSKEFLEFEGYDGLFQYIIKMEREKASGEEFPELYEKPWAFIMRPRQSLSTLYWRAIEAMGILLTQQEQDAYEQGYGLLEIYKGDAKSKEQVVLTPETNVGEMKAVWCQDYCLSHGYEVIHSLH